MAKPMLILSLCITLSSSGAPIEFCVSSDGLAVEMVAGDSEQCFTVETMPPSAMIPTGPYMFLGDASTEVTLGLNAARVSTSTDTTPLRLLFFETYKDLQLIFRRRMDERTSYQWSWELDQSPRTPVVVNVPSGPWTVAVTARGFKPLEKGIDIDGEPPSTWTVQLDPANEIEGKVLLGDTSEPAADAIIFNEEGELLTRADFWGRFRIPLTNDRPSAVRLEYPEYVPKVVEIPGEGNVLLPPVLLEKGGSLRLDVEFLVDEVPNAITATLLRQAPSSAWKEVAGTSLEGPGFEGEITGIDTGDYKLLLRGDEPLELTTRRVTIASGAETVETIEIEPSELAIEITRGDGPLPRARVEISGSWDAQIRVDDAGLFRSPIWDRGEFFVSVSHSELPLPHWTTASVVADEEQWEIEIPETLLEVTVTSDDGPIAGSKVAVQYSTEGMDAYKPGFTDSDGRVTFVGLPAGRHDLFAEAEGYLPAGPLKIVLGEDSELRLPVRLERGERSTVIVRHFDGRPAAGTVILATTAGGLLLAETRTDSEGVGKLEIPTHRPVVLFAIAGDGGFSVLRPPIEHAEPILMEISPTSAHLHLSVVDKHTRQPLNGVRFLLRYNFMTIPDVVLAMLERVQGRSFGTDRSGNLWLNQVPSGFYELWPWNPGMERSFAEQPPIRVELTEGTYSLEVQLEEQRRDGDFVSEGEQAAFISD